jgi:hypothetical protein
MFKMVGAGLATSLGGAGVVLVLFCCISLGVGRNPTERYYISIRSFRIALTEAVGLLGLMYGFFNLFR